MWLGSETKLVHIAEDQAGDVQMDADDEGDETANDLPSLSVKIQQDDQDEVQSSRRTQMKNKRMMKFMKRFERKHQSSQDTLKR